MTESLYSRKGYYHPSVEAIFVIRTTVAFDQAGKGAIEFGGLCNGAWIHRVNLLVKETFNGTNMTLSLGTKDQPDGLLSVENDELTKMGAPTATSGAMGAILAEDIALTATLKGSSITQGALEVCIEFCYANSVGNVKFHG